jgi:hypothetical protein
MVLRYLGLVPGVPYPLGGSRALSGGASVEEEA